MRQYSKGQHIWRALWPMLAFMGIQMVAGVIALIGLMIYYSVVMALDYTSPGAIDPLVVALESFEANVLVVLFISSVISLVFYFFMWRATRKTHIELNTGKISVPVILIVSGMFIGFNLLLVSVMDVTHIMDYFPDYLELIEALFRGGLIFRLLLIGVLVPIVEELCFRGVILNRLAAWTPKWVAVVVSGILFGIIHMNLFQGLYAGVVGILLGWAYIRTRNLWVPIIGHIAFNSINLLLIEYLEATGMDWPSLMAIIPMAALAGGCMVILHIYTNNINNLNSGEFD